MKKLIALSLSLVLLFSNVLVAFSENAFKFPFVEIDENFSIRNGIHFGISKEEVSSLEKAKESEPTDLDTYYGDNAYDLAYTTMLGAHFAYLVYWFDKDDKLDEFQYLLVGRNSSYESMKDSLIKKYGEPLFSQESDSVIVETRTDNVSKELRFMSSVDRNYAGWIFKYNDCYLFLEMKETFIEFANFLAIDYKILSYEELLSHQEAINALGNYLNDAYANAL